VRKRPNLRMQPTGPSGARLRSGKPSVRALRNIGLSRRGPEGLQLMRISLGRNHSDFEPDVVWRGP
jgi:hypothetical protein